MTATFLKKLKSHSLLLIGDFLRLFQRKQDLIIIDDAFPSLFSAFRLHEFNAYLNEAKRSKVYCSGLSFKLLEQGKGFSEIKNGYLKIYPQHSSKVIEYKYQPLKAKLAYFIFINNAYKYLDQITKYKIPFVFTLYPGGGFMLNNATSDEKLKKVFASPYFKQVIVTSKVTYNYLLSKNLCPVEKIKFIYGVVTSQKLFTKKLNNRKFESENKLLNVCFVAFKYTERGIDKGYDIFIDVAHLILKQTDRINFHVVGNFDENDIDVTHLKPYIKFHNALKSEDFVSFYNSMDILLSPNRSFVLNPGGFDGFPLGASVEAGLNGVALFVSDDLNQNQYFEDRKNIVIVNNAPEEIASIILHYLNNKQELSRLANSGREILTRLYDSDFQLGERMKIVKSFL